MNISIDTSIFRRDRKLDSSDILLLSKLCKLGLLKIHIPWIVYRESTTQNFLDIKTIVDKIIKDLNSFDKKGIGEIEHYKFQKISKQIQEIEIETSTIKHWTEFIENSKSTLHCIDEKDGELVMTAYFLGDAPFPEPKSRKDIPDAFIFQAIKKISENFGELVFITDDNNLKESCNKIENVNSIKSFSELYDLPAFHILNDKYKQVEHYADELLVLEDNIDEIKNQAEHDIWNEILNDIIIDSSNIPDDNNEGRLIDILKINYITLDKSKIQFVDDFFYIPVQSEGIFTIEYFLFKSDYYIYDDSRKITITDNDWNKHYFLVEETFEVKFSFKYKIAKSRVDFLEMEAEDIIFEEVTIIREK